MIMQMLFNKYYISVYTKNCMNVPNAKYIALPHHHHLRTECACTWTLDRHTTFLH